jgi:TonB family protein
MSRFFRDGMKRLIAFCFAGLLMVSAALPAQAEETHFTVRKRDDYPDFWISIERIGPCDIRGKPVDRPVIPWQKYYPVESMRRNETGKVVVRIIFDADSCPRSAIVLQSSGFGRLDVATLRVAMLIKTTMRSKSDDGQPTLVLPINWELTPR